MKLTEFADIIDQEIRLTYYSNQDGRWCCAFDRGEIMENGCLVSAHGNGKSPESAMREYAGIIAGKKLAFNAGSDRRKEYVAPKGLTA